MRFRYVSLLHCGVRVEEDGGGGGGAQLCIHCGGISVNDV